MSRLFNEEEKQFIFDNVEGKSAKELTELVNKKFNRNVTEKQIYLFKKRYNLRGNIHSRPPALFNEEEKKYIEEKIKGLPNDKFLEKFNKKFNRNITLKQLSSYKSHHKITSGLISGFYKGHIPKNYNKIGTETTRGDRVFIKVGNPSVYIEKKRYLYEKYKGKIPENHVVVFADGNKNNFDLDNLVLMSKVEHFIITTHGLNFKDKDLLESSILLAKESIKRWDAYIDYLKVTDYDKYLSKNQARHNKKIFRKMEA